jgi:ABC-type glutathione transport system ATPase component
LFAVESVGVFHVFAVCRHVGQGEFDAERVWHFSWGVVGYTVEGVTMIESIEFKNFKALRDTTLPLGPCTIIVGPNGSGKSTVLQALEAFRQPNDTSFWKAASFDVRDTTDATV